MKEKKTYEDQKKEVLRIAEEQFGYDYFIELEELLKEYSKEDSNYPNYIVKVNHKGAFYASEE